MLPLLYIRYFFLNKIAYKVFTLFLIFYAIIEFFQVFVKDFLLIKDNIFLFVYYFIGQFVLLSIFFKKLLGYKWIYYIMYAGLVFFAIQYVMEPQMYFRFNPLGSVISNVIIVSYSFLYFYKRLAEKGEFLIVNIGIFLYLLSSILVFASGNLIFNENISDEIPRLLVRINRILFLVFQVLILVEWWKNYATPYKKAE